MAPPARARAAATATAIERAGPRGRDALCPECCSSEARTAGGSAPAVRPLGVAVDVGVGVGVCCGSLLLADWAWKAALPRSAATSASMFRPRLAATLRAWATTNTASGSSARSPCSRARSCSIPIWRRSACSSRLSPWAWRACSSRWPSRCSSGIRSTLTGWAIVQGGAIGAGGSGQDPTRCSSTGVCPSNASGHCDRKKRICPVSVRKCEASPPCKAWPAS